jgi:hypothetical protein
MSAAMPVARRRPPALLAALALGALLLSAGCASRDANAPVTASAHAPAAPRPTPNADPDRTHFSVYLDWADYKAYRDADPAKRSAGQYAGEFVGTLIVGSLASAIGIHLDLMPVSANFSLEERSEHGSARTVDQHLLLRGTNTWTDKLPPGEVTLTLIIDTPRLSKRCLLQTITVPAPDGRVAINLFRQIRENEAGGGPAGTASASAPATAPAPAASATAAVSATAAQATP